MDAAQENMLKQVMAVDFAAGDLHLYLNTHPYDQKAVIIYACLVQNAKLLRANYERMYGPITASSAVTCCPWPWIKSPWPWESH